MQKKKQSELLTKKVFDDGTIEFHPVKQTKTLIFLHGACEEPVEFAHLIENDIFPVPDNCKVILPAAPERGSTKQVIDTFPDETDRQKEVKSWFEKNMTAKMYGNFTTQRLWIWGGNANQGREMSQEDTRNESASSIRKLIHSESNIVGAGNVHLSGFSNGARLAYYMYMSQNIRLGSVSVLSCRHTAKWYPSIQPGMCSSPLLVYHGYEDPMSHIGSMHRNLESVIKASGSKAIKFIKVPGMGHDNGLLPYPTLSTDQSKSASTTNKFVSTFFNGMRDMIEDIQAQTPAQQARSSPGSWAKQRTSPLRSHRSSGYPASPTIRIHSTRTTPKSTTSMDGGFESGVARMSPGSGVTMNITSVNQRKKLRTQFEHPLNSGSTLVLDSAPRKSKSPKDKVIVMDLDENSTVTELIEAAEMR